jgi:predicted permease
VLLLLVTAFANVGNLFLIRSATRAREVGIRAALGATRARLAGHALSESLLLAAVAGVGAVAIAGGGLQMLVRFAPRDVPRLADAHLHGTAVAVAFGAALLAGLVFASIPVLRHSVRATRLRSGTRGAGTSGVSRALRDGLVITQVALALVLLVGAGLMLRSFTALTAVHPGLQAQGVSTFELLLPRDGYPDDARTAQFHRTLHARLAAVPGVRRVGATTVLPMRDMETACRMVFRPDEPYAAGLEAPCVPTPKVTPGFFEALGMRVRGRIPEWRDAVPGHGVAVVTAELAERLWPGQEALGRTINSSGSGVNAPTYEVVGIVHGLRGAGFDAPATEAVFYPPVAAADDAWWSPMRRTTYVISASPAGREGLIEAVRQAVAGIDARVAVANPMRMEAVLQRSTARQSFILMLLGAASGLALLLAAVGLYGVVSYLVSQRRGEIGIRMALGARVSQVAGMVMMHSVRLAIIGAAIGVAAALAGARFMRAMLFEVSPTDPLIYVAVAAAMLLIAAAASVGPARRAARVAPADALRSE